jgi:cytosine/adenosine deaminase-related metal-dependent hydrolase
MAQTTVIKNAAWLVAWDDSLGGHRYLRHADLAFADERIVHIGADYDGPADHRIDGTKRLVLPGLVNIYSHALCEPMTKGFAEDTGNPRLGMSGL